jgi:hypothetical protein
MSKLYPVAADVAANTRIRAADYAALYAESVTDADAFWGRIGRRLDWITPYTKVKNVSYDLRDFRIRWFEDGELNLSANCLDRHLATRGDKTPFFGKAMIRPNRARSATASCMSRSAARPTCSRISASKRATASPSTCR